MLRRIKNYLPHAIYINCRNHQLALCFKHQRNDFPRLKAIDSVLLGLWKPFHSSCTNRFIFDKIQEAYCLKTLSIIKAAIIRGLSDGSACKKCCEGSCIILESLDDMTNDPKAELIVIRDQLLQQNNDNADFFSRRCFECNECFVIGFTVKPQRFWLPEKICLIHHQSVRANTKECQKFIDGRWRN